MSLLRDRARQASSGMRQVIRQDMAAKRPVLTRGGAPLWAKVKKLAAQRAAGRRSGV